jgi:ubiquinone/menaquinone biosynthesis C-methylase UbiE
MVDGAAIKTAQKATWTAGDYAEIATRITSAAETLVGAMDFAEGVEGLDIASGTGNATIPAAERGARMTGLDLTPKLVELARERAANEGVEIDFVEGDAENLPYDDDSFDRVISVFGVMFAPDQPRAAAEMMRVCRPGGRIGFCAWTPDGLNGRMFRTIGGHMPPPPEGFMPPVLWGSEDHVRELFADCGAEPEFSREHVLWADESVERWLDEGERTLGPMVMAKQALEPAGKWDAARGDLEALYAECNEADDGTMRVPAEYLMTTLSLPD